jgi:hypothetical protein
MVFTSSTSRGNPKVPQPAKQSRLRSVPSQVYADYGVVKVKVQLV